jgi:hypothetical protein
VIRDFLKLMALLLIVLFGLNFTSAVPVLAQDEGGLETIVSTRLRLRDGPGVDWVVLGVVEAGESVRLDGRATYEDHIWVRGITQAGQIGWMYGEYLEASDEALRALRIVWVDDPFTLAIPEAPPAPEVAVEAEAPVDPTPVPAATFAAPLTPRNYGVISGIGANTRRIFQQGQTLGNRANVFVKVGDSITHDRHFLAAIGWGAYNLHNYSNLQPVIDYFSAVQVRDGNSFTNSSLAAHNSWTTTSVLNPERAWREVCGEGESPLICEYRVAQPSIALIMLGTNDVVLTPIEVYRDNLSAIVQISIDSGVIPVLSTLPPRPEYQDRVVAYNQVITEVARAYAVPLWDFGSTLYGLPNLGLEDGIHPSTPAGNQAADYASTVDFSAHNLQYGFTQRNLSALQVLDAIWRNVMN